MWIPEEVRQLVRAGDEGHACRVAILAREAASTVGVSPVLGYLAGLVHEVGKLSVPLKLLGPGQVLSEAQGKRLRAYPVAGEQLLGRVWPEVPVEVAVAVRQHRERPDGTGFPEGLREVSALAVVVGVADLVDERTWGREVKGPREVLRLVEDEKLPPEVVTAVVAGWMRVEAVRTSEFSGGCERQDAVTQQMEPLSEVIAEDRLSQQVRAG